MLQISDAAFLLLRNRTMGLENRFELFMILKQTLSVLYMKIRQIIVPKSKEAELALDFDEASDSDLFIFN